MNRSQLQQRVEKLEEKRGNGRVTSLDVVRALEVFRTMQQLPTHPRLRKYVEGAQALMGYHLTEK